MILKSRETLAVTPMSSFTKIDDTSSDAETLRTEISMSAQSRDVLGQSRDGFAVVGKVDDKPTVKDDQQRPTLSPF